MVLAVCVWGGGARRKPESSRCKEQRGGCGDHADEEKCPTVLDQAERRHLGAQISHPEPTWGTCERQDASVAAALLFLFNPAFLF